MEGHAMKKAKNTVIYTMIVMAVCICLAVCSRQSIKAKSDVTESESKIKKAYQILNDGMFVLEGTVTMSGDRIISCDINEFNAMVIWGKFSNNNITKEEITKLGENNIQTALFQDNVGGPADTRFAKYTQVGDVIFTAGVDSKGFIDYTSEKTGNVISYFEKSEENIAWYIDQMRAGNYWFLIKTGDSFEKLDLASFYEDSTRGKL
jgi:hypothetical protein